MSKVLTWEPTAEKAARINDYLAEMKRLQEQIQQGRRNIERKQTSNAATIAEINAVLAMPFSSGSPKIGG